MAAVRNKTIYHVCNSHEKFAQGRTDEDEGKAVPKTGAELLKVE